MRVADDEGHRHGLAERAAERQHDAADDADARVGDHDLADHLAGGAAEPVGRFLEHRRHGGEHVARDRRDEGQHHDRQDEAGGEHADAVGRPGEHPVESRHGTEEGDDAGLDVGLHERGEDEQAPDAVDDGRDAGEQLDGDADRLAQRLRAELAEEDGDAEPDGDGDGHGDDRRDHRAEDGSARPVLVGDRVPRFGPQEPEAELLRRRDRADHEGDDDAAEQHQHGGGRGEGQAVEDAVADPKAGERPGAIEHVSLFDRPLRRQVHHVTLQTVTL